MDKIIGVRKKKMGWSFLSIKASHVALAITVFPKITLKGKCLG